MTPDIIKTEKTSKYKIELSKGKFMDSMIYGVTVWCIKSLENLDLSKPFQSENEALEYIESIK